jgi:phosphatidylglycerophosphate synthase
MLRIHNSKIKNDKATSVSFLAKTKTFVQFVAIIGFLIAFYLNIPLIIFISNFILLLSVILSIKTALDYTLNSFSN